NQQNEATAPNDPEITLALIALPDFTGAYGAVSFGDKVYFTGEKETKNGEKSNPINGNTFTDVYVVNKEDNGEWKTPKSVAGVDTKYHDGPFCFSAGGETVYLTRSA